MPKEPPDRIDQLVGAIQELVAALGTDTMVNLMQTGSQLRLEMSGDGSRPRPPAPTAQSRVVFDYAVLLGLLGRRDAPPSLVSADRNPEGELVFCRLDGSKFLPAACQAWVQAASGKCEFAVLTPGVDREGNPILTVRLRKIGDAEPITRIELRAADDSPLALAPPQQPLRWAQRAAAVAAE